MQVACLFRETKLEGREQGKSERPAFNKSILNKVISF